MRIQSMGTCLSAVLCLAAAPLPSCRGKPAGPIEIAAFPLDGLDGVIDRSEAAFDPAVSSDGKGSLKIESGAPVTVRLFEVRAQKLDRSQLTYQARLRTEKVGGKAYLEMLCHFPGGSEFFSRGLKDPLSADTGWVTQQIPFFLKKGENPDFVRLNVVLEGSGTVWIDDIHLYKTPL
jgi:hypothetical protein